MNAFEIFKAGTHKSNRGFEKTYSKDDLQLIADNYNNGSDDSPIVIGHPHDNSPAYGWVKSLFVQDDTLFAEPKDLVNEFVSAVKKNLFKNRSISLTPDLKLNHIGFLGGKAPAVKGLSPVEFSTDDYLLFDSSFPQSHSSDDTNPSDNSDSSDAVDNLQSDNSNLLFSQLNNTLSSFMSEFQNLLSNSNIEFSSQDKDSIGKIEKRMSELRSKIDTSEFEMSLDKRVQSGNLTPGMKSKALETLNYFENLDYSSLDEYDFSKDIRSLLLNFIDSIPKLTNFSDTVADNISDEQKSVDMSEFDNFDMDPDSAKLHESIVNKMNSDNISYEEAFSKVINSYE